MLIESAEHDVFTIEIHTDEYPESPRDWDNFGTMICFHSRYALGDKHDMDIDELTALVARADVYSLPLYLSYHSGLAMNTTGFSCPWDSGQIGYTYVTREKVLSEFGVDVVDTKLLEKIYTYLRAEVATYDAYLRGDVYGYTILDSDGETVHSCYGYYDTGDCRLQAENALQWHVSEQFRIDAETMPCYI